MTQYLNFKRMAACSGITAAGLALAAWVFAFGSPLCPAAPATGLPLAAETFEAAWKIIQETHFDTNFNGLDWYRIREELKPRAEAAQTGDDLRAVIQDMLDRLGQSHMTIIPGWVSRNLETRARPGASASKPNPDRGASGTQPAPAGTPSPPDSPSTGRPAAGLSGEVGMEIRPWQGRYLVTRVDPLGPAATAGVRPGWILVSVDGDPVESFASGIPQRTNPRQAGLMAWSMVANRLKGPEEAPVRLEFLNGSDRQVGLELKRQKAPGVPVKLGFLPQFHAAHQHERLPLANGCTAGLVRFNLWMLPIAGALDQAIDELRDADGMILDLRGNLGGVAAMPMGFAGHFFTEPDSLGTMKTRDTVLQFRVNPRLVNPAGRRVQPFSRPVAILVDAFSASTSELFAGGMQALGRARVFGQTTAGQVLPAMFDRLPNGDTLVHVFADFQTPNHRRLEGLGVAPDEEAAYDRAGLLAGRDTQLEAALKWLASAHRAVPESSP